MTDREQPLEETPQAAAAVEDESTLPQLATDGGPNEETPTFEEPGESLAEAAPTEELIGDPHGAGSPGSGENIRTGGDQPWDPEDLAAARGQDPTPEHVERARRDLDQEGGAAIEKTVP